MGQKTHPYAFRIGIVNDWKSRWFSDKDYTKLVNQDYRIREFLTAELLKGALSRIDIERTRDKVQVDIHTARPGVVIGRKGAEADRLRKGLEELTNQPVKLNIIEVREAELDAQLLARAVADQLENRVAFRRAMKRAVGSALKAGAEGVRVELVEFSLEVETIALSPEAAIVSLESELSLVIDLLNSLGLNILSSLAFLAII